MNLVVLLGPQRFRPTVREIVRSLQVEGPIATVTAGWEEREPDDAELDGLLDGRSANLALYRRWLDVFESDPDFAAADRRRRDVLDELRAIYEIRLHHHMAAVAELQQHHGDPAISSAAVDDQVETVRGLDARHLERVREVHAEFHYAWPPHERPVVAAHRAEIAEILGRAGALAIGGGHVGVLLSSLHLFNLAAAVRRLPVVAWSAGAMAVAETVVLFGDRAAHGPGHAEVFDSGLGLARGVVPLPHARRRLRLDDRRRMALFVRRFAPAHCLVLDDGAQVRCSDGVCCPSGSLVLGDNGAVTTVAA